MSKWSWIDTLDLSGVNATINLVAEQEDRLRLELLELQEKRRVLEYRRNRLRREAGEIA